MGQLTTYRNQKGCVMKKVEDVKIWQVLELVKKRVAKNYTRDGSNIREFGICYAVDMVIDSLTGSSKIHNFDRMDGDCFGDWKGFSGNRLYPVEGNMFEFCENDHKWHKRTEYGRRRWELLEHCILWFKERNI